MSTKRGLKAGGQGGGGDERVYGGNVLGEGGYQREHTATFGDASPPPPLVRALEALRLAGKAVGEVECQRQYPLLPYVRPDSPDISQI